ncbi:hypothetical protein [Nitrospirillum bahiense]|uniref:Uncharacterized protein n=1 Tax=Nitrospirillum amazonense TaxID=28077 RepID=A0A560FJE6_9PROT|nr:hypothetical protein [Nitrospirillum amazonense]TWB21732.1 hypothetical protein FBZ88_11786 [Nitrospirillum amazonense]
MNPQFQQRVITQANRVSHEDHEVFIFDLNDIMKLNDSLKDNYDTDAVSLTQLVQSGIQVSKQIKLLGVLGLAYIKTASDGRQYLIFKGYAGHRPNLSGTRYALENPKVGCFVVGTRELLKDAAKATRIAVIAFIAIDIVKECLADHFSLARLGVQIASDIAQAVAASAIGVGVGAAVISVVGTAAMPVVAIFALTVAAGFFAGMALTWLDNKYQLTNQLVAAAMKIEDDLAAREAGFFADVRQAATSIYETTVEVYGVTVKIYRLWQRAEDLVHYDWTLPRLSSGF